MKRFISYLYQYENENKGQNCGFAKVDMREEEIRFEVHYRGKSTLSEKQKVYLVGKSTELVLVTVGELVITRGQGNLQSALVKKELESYSLQDQDLIGVAVLGKDQEYMALSRWTEDEEMQFGMYDIRDCIQKRKKTESAVRMENCPASEAKPLQERACTNNLEPVPEMAFATGPCQEFQPDCATRSCPVPELDNNRMPQAMPELENNRMPQAMPELERNRMSQAMPELRRESCPRRFPAMEAPTEEIGNCEAQRPGKIRWEKIDLKRIRELPEEYWYLGNNSFVLHGYFQHQYLALGRNPSNPQCIYFGVPGKKHREEELLAMVFGFYEFEPIESQEEAMGYWVSRLEIKLN